MAGLPPRSRSRSLCSSTKDRSPLETLQHMGFPKDRAEKAIAATGNRGVQLASEWLLSHVNDPLLDYPDPREYIMYLCPTGELLDRLQEFWEVSFQGCGWNSAHIYHPHITLCAFFKIPNSKVGVIDSVMNVVTQEINQWPSVGPLGLDFFTQNKNFIGYFVKSPHHQYLEQLMIRVQDEFLKHGIDMKPQMKQLHLTVAFQYETSHHDSLLALAQDLHINCSAAWEVRVYSRIQELKTEEVRKVIKHYKPVQPDEMELTQGDFVHMNPSELETSPDGWYSGTSWLTGVTALFPGNFTVKCSQMEMWTLHRYVSIPSLASPVPSRNGFGAVAPKAQGQLRNIKEGDYDNLWNSGNANNGPIYAQVNKKDTGRALMPRKLFVVRHAERCDFAFFRSWFERSFSASGEYTRFNLNCPKQMVPRASFKDFNKDCPLTMMGKEQARLTGEALREAGESITYIYCSPALRCVETATALMTAYGSKSQMWIEPSLFEWLGWYKPNMPTFMTPEELLKAGFPVDPSYKAYVKFANIKVHETIEDYYIRSHNFTQQILRKHKSDGGNVLIIGHSGSLDACTRQLQGKPVRNTEEFRAIVRGCPYCCLATAVEDVTTGKWMLVEPSIPLLTHGANKDYSWDTLQN